jgi:GNAT superfamily N-acetyltransferase
MIELRVARTDEDFDAWRKVRRTVVPYERAPTVAECRHSAQQEQLLVLAETAGAVVGSGIAGRSTLAGRGFVAPRVLHRARRRGVGSAILRALADHVAELGFERAFATADDPDALAFATRFGFREVGRQVEQVRTIGDEPEPSPLAGIRIVSAADRPELWSLAYDAVAVEAFADLPVPSPAHVSREEWATEWMTWPEGTFVALEADEIVGVAGLLRDTDRQSRAEHALTAVRRDRRGRGIASALKRTTLAWAAHSGVREVYTWTQRGNADMRRLNAHLGYATRRECVNLEAPLPLP